MRIAAFNVENLFDRAKAFNHDAVESTEILRRHSKLNSLFERSTYTSNVKRDMLALMTDLGILRSNTGPYVQLRKIRGQLISRPRTAAPYIKASGRSDWVGWCELRTAHVNEIAIQNTARVIKDVDADILAMVEIESRPVLKEFNETVFKEIGGTPYPNLMVIDGNDLRGIDVGLMTKAGLSLGKMRSHVHDLKPDGHPIFSRDCPEYEVSGRNDETIVVLPNHFKSKFGGNNAASRAKRLAQATATKQIYRRLIAEGYRNVVILGDLNDTPDSTELMPLLQDTDLRDVSDHPRFDQYEFNAQNGQKGIGTFGLGNDSAKIDFLLLSPALYAAMEQGGIFRKGAWPGSSPRRWETYPELTKKMHVASDHHAIWVDLEI